MPSDAGENSTTPETFEAAAAEARAIPVEEAAAATAPSVSPVVEAVPDEAGIKEAGSRFIAEMIPFGVLAQFRGKHWLIEKEQVEMLAPIWCRLLDKYLPGWWSEMGVEAQLLVVLLPLILAKYQHDRELQTMAAPHAEAKAAKAAMPDTAKSQTWEGGPVGSL